MSTKDEYELPMAAMWEEMASQMAKPENVEKTSWNDKTYMELRGEIERNLAKLTFAIEAVDSESAWRRAANIANYAWMIAAKVELEADLGIHGGTNVEPTDDSTPAS